MSTKKNFPPYEEASKIAIEKGIKSQSEYKAQYKELGLPCGPNNFYKEDWVDWFSFLGKEKITYPPYEEASKIAIEKGINTPKGYWAKHKELGLPSSPNVFYKDKGWIDWPSFLGREKKSYLSYERTREMMKEVGINSRTKYKTRYKELGLPANPNYSYKEEWIDWPSFLGNKKKTKHSYEDAKRILIENGIKSEKEYKTRYKELGLPSNPHRTYKDKGWIDWPSFFDKETKPDHSYEDAKRIVIENNIKSVIVYKAKCKELSLPSHPDGSYKGKGWVDWGDFFGRPHKTTPKERKTKVLSKLALNPILLGDKAPLQIIYMLATNMDRELAEEIEILLKMMSCEERLDWVKEQLKTLLVDTPTTSDTSNETLEDEMSAMESMMDVFEDTFDDLSEEDSTNIKTILENYYHNVINKDLIEECDG